MELKQKEIIKEIDFFEGKYAVSSLGYVFNQYTGKILKPYLLKKYNHYVIHLWLYDCRRQMPLHMLLAKAFIKNPNNYRHVFHVNGNTLDNRLSNLCWYNKSNTYRYKGFDDTEERKINKFSERKKQFNEKQKNKHLREYENYKFDKYNFLNQFN